MANRLDRRQFLKQATATGILASIVDLETGCHGPDRRPALLDWSDRPRDQVKVGFVGIGNMGRGHVNNLLKVPGCHIAAVCDILEDRAQWARDRVLASGQPEPKVFLDFKELCQEDLDLVYTATPWQWHTPVCITAMQNGKHVACEVPIATTLDECWQLVETAQKYRRYCVMMENCCYDRLEMAVLNMVREGLFGELLHAECGYLHDLRELKLSPTYYQGQWRLQYAIHRNGNPYPTHGLGPVAWCMDILRGDRFEYLVSVSTKSVGLNLYARTKYPRWAQQQFKLGDVNTTLISTAKGRTIIVKHDTHLPRPYSRDFLIQGTKGLVRKYPQPLIYVESEASQDQWQQIGPFLEQYEHPIWRSLQEKAKGSGHGGMDYIEDYRLIQSLRQGLPPDIDVYDSVTWSAIFPLSERSVEAKGRPISVPDFTGGLWDKHRDLGVFAHPQL